MDGNNLNLTMIRVFIKNNNLTDQEFCEISKISKDDFDKIMVLDYDVSAEILPKLARILKVEIYQLFI